MRRSNPTVAVPVAVPLSWQLAAQPAAQQQYQWRDTFHVGPVLSTNPKNVLRRLRRQQACATQKQQSTVASAAEAEPALATVETVDPVDEAADEPVQLAASAAPADAHTTALAQETAAAADIPEDLAGISSASPMLAANEAADEAVDDEPVDDEPVDDDQPPMLLRRSQQLRARQQQQEAADSASSSDSALESDPSSADEAVDVQPVDDQPVDDQPVDEDQPPFLRRSQRLRQQQQEAADSASSSDSASDGGLPSDVRRLSRPHKWRPTREQLISSHPSSAALARAAAERAGSVDHLGRQYFDTSLSAGEYMRHRLGSPPNDVPGRGEPTLSGVTYSFSAYAPQLPL